MNYCKLLIFFLLLCDADFAMARIIYYGSQVETLILPYGHPTLVRFPNAVKTISQASRFIIAPADQTQPDYALLSITPRFRKGHNLVTFVLANGSTIKTKLRVVTKTLPENIDRFYDLKPKDLLIKKKINGGAKDSKISELQLLKAMIRGERIADYGVKNLKRPIKTGLKDIDCQLKQIYTGAKFNGYVFVIKNRSKDRSYSIDITKLTLGNPNAALLSQIDRKMLGYSGKKDSQTILRIVAKPASIYKQVALPITKVEQKQ